MSLIQEALRRKQEEAGESPTPPTPVPTPPSLKEQPPVPPVPPPPPPMPFPEEEEQPKKKRRKRKNLSWVALLVMLILFGGLAAVATWGAYRGYEYWKSSQASEQEDPAPPEKTEPPPIPEPPPPPPEPEPPQPEPEPLPPPQPELEPGPVIWPKLKVMSMVGRGTTGSVIINNEIIGVGEAIEGVELLELDHPHAILSYKGQTQRVRIGRYTKELVAESP